MRLSDGEVAILRELLRGPAATSSVTIEGRSVVHARTAQSMVEEGWVTIDGDFAKVTSAGKRALDLHEAERIQRESDAVVVLLDELVERLAKTVGSFTTGELVLEWKASETLWWDAGGDSKQARRHAMARAQRHVKGMVDRGELLVADEPGKTWQHRRYRLPPV